MSAHPEWSVGWWADIEARFRAYYSTDPFAMSWGRMVALFNRLGCLEKKRTDREMVDDVMKHSRPEDVLEKD